MRKLLLYVLFLLSISCVGNRKADIKAFGASPIEENDYFVFDFESEKTGIPTIGTLNELIESISYIPLETHKDALLPAGPYGFTKIGSDIFIGGHIMMSAPFYQFDSSGKFVKQITYHGRGPNEILGSLGWSANANLKWLTVVSSGSYMVTTSVETGQRSTTVSIDTSQGFERLLLNDGTFVSAQTLSSEHIPNTYLYFTDMDGNLIHSIARNDELLKYNANMTENLQVPPYEIYRLWPDYTGDAIFQDIFNDTIYRIKNHREIIPHLVFKKGRLSPNPKDKLNKENKDKQVYFHYVMESGDYVFLNYSYQNETWRDVWSKRERKLLIRMVSERYGTAIDIVAPFELPDGSIINIQVGYADQDHLYCILEAIHACKFLPELKEDDNPVIVVAKLK